MSPSGNIRTENIKDVLNYERMTLFIESFLRRGISASNVIIHFRNVT